MKTFLLQILLFASVQTLAATSKGFFNYQCNWGRDYHLSFIRNEFGLSLLIIDGNQSLELQETHLEIRETGSEINVTAVPPSRSYFKKFEVTFPAFNPLHEYNVQLRFVNGDELQFQCRDEPGR